MEAADSRNAIDELQKQISQLQRNERRRRLQRWLQRRFTGPHLLRVPSSVILPGGYFIAAAFFSAIAKARLDDSLFNSVEWWVTSLVALSLGLLFLVLTLREVERVRRTTEEAYFKGQVEAMKQAMAEREEETRPVCEVFCDDATPIRMRPGEEQNITFLVRVAHGYAVHHCRINIFAPPGFTIVNPAGEPVSNIPNAIYPGWTAALVFDDMLLTRGLTYSTPVTIKAPQSEGNYKFGFALVSEEYGFSTSEDTESEIPVEVLE